MRYISFIDGQSDSLTLRVWTHDHTTGSCIETELLDVTVSGCEPGSEAASLYRLLRLAAEVLWIERPAHTA